MVKVLQRGGKERDRETIHTEANYRSQSKQKWGKLERKNIEKRT